MLSISDTDDDQATTERLLTIGAAVILLIAGLAAGFTGDDADKSPDAAISTTTSIPTSAALGTEVLPPQPDATTALPTDPVTTMLQRSCETPPQLQTARGVSIFETTTERPVLIVYLTENLISGELCDFSAAVVAPDAFSSEGSPPNREEQVGHVDNAISEAVEQLCLQQGCEIDLVVIGQSPRGSVLAADWVCDGEFDGEIKALFVSESWVISDIEFCDTASETHQANSVPQAPMLPGSPNPMIEFVNPMIDELSRQG